MMTRPLGATPEELANLCRSLKPCPFCGSNLLTLDHLIDADDYYVSCNTCEIQQLASYSPQDAADRWNTRKPETITGPDEKPIDLSLIRAHVQAARQIIWDLNAGSRQWLLSVPARPGIDPDLVMSEVLSDAELMATTLQTINTPELPDFVKGVQMEAQHQRLRWPSEQDAGKEPEDWFWLVGYLGGKACRAHISGDVAKALHHTISTASALANWHAAILGKTNMRPGIAEPVSEVGE